MSNAIAVQENMDKFEKVAAALGWVAARDRTIEGWNQYIVFNGNGGRRFSVNVHPAQFVIAGLTSVEFEKHGCYLSSQESGKLSGTTSRMSASKPVEVLVKEIQRRVVVPYENFFGIMSDKVEQAQDYIKQTAEAAIRAGNILDAHPKGFQWDDEEFVPTAGEEVRLVKSFPEGVSLHIRFYHESVRWEYVSLPHDLHEKLCWVIVDHFKRSKK